MQTREEGVMEWICGKPVVRMISSESESAASQERPRDRETDTGREW